MSGFLSSLIGLLSSVGVAKDALFNYATLLLNGDGTNGAQNNTFLDSSSNNFTITRTGTPTQGTFSPFSQTGWSAGEFPGTTGNYLSMPDSTALSLAGSTFTIEAWVYRTSTNTAYQQFVINKRGQTNPYTFSWQLGFSSGNVSFITTGGSYTGTTVAPINTWVHIAAVVSGTTLTLYLNGNSTYTTSSFSMTEVATPVCIGAYPIEFAGQPGFYSNIRIVKGVAVYTGTFTPPTTPLTRTQSAGANISAITGTQTSLLTLQDNRFVDNAVVPNTITVVGSISIQAFSPFAPAIPYSAAVVGGSFYTDNANTSYLSVPANSSLTTLTGDFTLEAWVYRTSTAAYFSILDLRSTSGGSAYGYWIDSSGFADFYIGTDRSATTAVQNNAWNHVAFVRIGSTYTHYINGTAAGTGSLSGTITATATTALIARMQNAFTNPALIGSLRVVNGTGVYTGNFTVPTGPFTATQSANPFGGSNTAAISSGTSLLLNFTNAGITDATAKNDLVTVGSAQVSTSVVKFGTGSMSFNGSGSYLTIQDQSVDRLGTGDFVIEGWVNLAAIGAVRGFISKGTSTTGWSVGVNALNQLVFSYASSTLTGTTALTISTWYYFAVVRSGSATGNVKIYSGTTGAVTTEATSGTAITTDFSGTDVMYIGADRTAANVLNGNLDDLRITRAARVITVVPTAAFPVQ